MSRAYKCDRCGTLCEYEKCRNNSLFVNKWEGYKNKILDLCPKCQKELNDWFGCDKEVVNDNFFYDNELFANYSEENEKFLNQPNL